MGALRVRLGGNNSFCLVCLAWIKTPGVGVQMQTRRRVWSEIGVTDARDAFCHASDGLGAIISTTGSSFVDDGLFLYPAGDIIGDLTS